MLCLVNSLVENEYEIDIFRALGHPLRRKIIKFIAERGAASYKDLSKIEPKAGVLYHHIRLLGDLIYQDEKKLYRLTEKGKRAYEFLVSSFLVPEDKSIHKFLTPRWLFESIEGKNALFVIFFFLVTCITWYFQESYIPVLLVVVPGYKCRYVPIYLLPIINWLSATVTLKLVVKYVYGKRIKFTYLVAKLALAFTIMNIFPLSLMTANPYVELLLYFIMQIFAMLFIISALSIEARLPLKSSALVVIAIHYLSVLAALALIYFG